MNQEQRRDRRMDILKALGTWQCFQLVADAKDSTEPVIVDDTFAARYQQSKGGIFYLLDDLRSAGIVEMGTKDGCFTYSLNRSDETTNKLIDLLYE